MLQITNLVIECNAMNQSISFPEWVSKQEASGHPKAELARDLKIEVASLYRYLARERVPSRPVMDRIIKLSSGTVDVSWFFVPSPRKEEAI